MSDSAKEQLLGYLVGALDDAQREEIELRLKSDPRFRREADLLRGQIQPLERLREDCTPPPGLAKRTCRLVASEAAAASRPDSRPTPMSEEAAPASWVGRISWLDIVVAATVFIAAFVLTPPAIQYSRSRARETACKDNLREVGRALISYSDGHDGCFPQVPTKGPGAAAGIYAPMLKEVNLLTDDKRVVCPGSSLAQQQSHRIPTTDELQAASPEELRHLRATMGGSYGYSLGYMLDGVYFPVRNQRRPHFALMADTPVTDGRNRQTLNHDGRGQNVLFEDGHVDFATSSLANPLTGDIFSNDDGAMAAGIHIEDSVIGPSATPPVIYVDF